MTEEEQLEAIEREFQDVITDDPNLEWVFKQAKQKQSYEIYAKELKDRFEHLSEQHDLALEQNKRYEEAIDKIMECVNEHLSYGTEINPYKIDDIIDDLEDKQ